MTALFALVSALLSFGASPPTMLHVHATPACAIVKDPNGGCDPGTMRPRQNAVHVHVGSPSVCPIRDPDGHCIA
jgi:hypothetical protein